MISHGHAGRPIIPLVKSFGLCSCAAHASSREWLARQAGVKPEQIAMHAFLLDPTTQARRDLDQTQSLLDETLEANRAYLPLFFR
jgi:alpha-galactosidase/6-phospho-beta-glucosidase family protein